MSKLLILSDVHGNWAALSAVIAAESAVDDVAFCGDVVDYGPEPVACLHWLRKHAKFAVRGNHDNALAFAQDCRCMGSFRPMSLATRAWHRTLLSSEDRNYLAQLPALDWFPFDGRHFRMAHATPQGDMFEYLAEGEWCARVGDIDADVALLGHTHVQGVRRCGAVTVVNPGSVGLARDTPGLACYAVYENGEVTTKRIPYHTEQTVAALRRAPLERDIIENLAYVFAGSRNGITEAACE